MRRLLLIILTSALPTGCVLFGPVGPDYVPPAPELPDRWHQELLRGIESGEAELRTWWTAFRDPTLDGLIERADDGNLDLAQAVGRIQEARAFLGLARGELMPDVDGAGAAQRSRESENVFGAISPPGKRTDTFYQLGIDSSWEIDLWGRILRSVEASEGSLQASIEDYRDVRVSLYADVAATYVDVRSLQARLAFALGNVETQRASLKLTGDRRDAGIGSDLEVAQAEQNLARTEAFVPVLRIQLAAAIHRLGVLLGLPPASLYAEVGAVAPVPTPPDAVLVDLPGELVRQRPDIRRAERLLAAQTARIGVATGDLYPRFSLTGFFAFESLISSKTLEADSAAYSFGPAFRWNLFDGGRVRSAIRVEDARTEQALAFYEQTVLQGLEDVENSVVSYVQERERADALLRSADASRQAVKLVNVLYRAGLTDFQNVLDSERSLFEREDELAESQGLAVKNLIRIYRALGGGWGLPSGTAPGP